MVGKTFRVFRNGYVSNGASVWRCALGPAGIVPRKLEGDGGTPEGRFRFRRILFRADRVAPPKTRLPMRVIEPTDGWCDDVTSPFYNRPIRTDLGVRHEVLWREDHRYDVICVMGHNDRPPQRNQGSAIFLHVAAPDLSPTQGCVALDYGDLCSVLAEIGVLDQIEICDEEYSDIKTNAVLSA